MYTFSAVTEPDIIFSASWIRLVYIWIVLIWVPLEGQTKESARRDKRPSSVYCVAVHMFLLCPPKPYAPKPYAPKPYGPKVQSHMGQNHMLQTHMLQNHMLQNHMLQKHLLLFIRRNRWSPLPWNRLLVKWSNIIRMVILDIILFVGFL